MTDRIPKAALLFGSLLAGGALCFAAYSNPGYFTSHTYLGGLVLLECLAVAIWFYRRIFFPIVIVTFLLAGVDLPLLGSVWTLARWGALAAGALVGSAIMLKERRYHFGLFHVIALFCVFAASVSVAVSRYTTLSVLKVLSLLLLFVYASTGARLAVADRENRFFGGLLMACEIFVAIEFAFFLAGIEVMGNPNSLGAVMGVAAAPILLWGTLLKQPPLVHHRRLVMYGLCMYMAFASHARAGLLAAFVSCGLLCVALRRYSLLAQGIGMIAVLAAGSAIINPDGFSQTISGFTSTIVFKGTDPSQSLLASRESPWQETVDSIRHHFWFGTGFGTADNGQDKVEEFGKFSSNSATSAEHGSSYLAMTAYVGMLGVIPFVLLLGYLLFNIARTVIWMFRTGDPAHGAIPVAMVLVAGLVHAFFEDWLFAVGYYLCVFFWSMAFIFQDQTRSFVQADWRSVNSWRNHPVAQQLGVIAPGR